LQEDGLVRVENTCVNNGNSTNIVGSARPLSNSELQVRFPGSPNLPGANYVIKNVWVNAEGEYERALVVSPLIPFTPASLQFTWILARKPTISDEEIKESLDYAVAAGYNPTAANWQRTEQVTCRITQ
jgi:lipocalin